MPSAIAVTRQAPWFDVKDWGCSDAVGYFYHVGRSDEVIISAGWTMSAVEIEHTLLTHVLVVDAAVIGVPSVLWGSAIRRMTCAPRGERMARGILKPVIERLHVDVDETRYGDSRDFTACLRSPPF